MPETGAVMSSRSSRSRSERRCLGAVPARCDCRSRRRVIASSRWRGAELQHLDVDLGDPPLGLGLAGGQLAQRPLEVGGRRAAACSTVEACASPRSSSDCWFEQLLLRSARAASRSDGLLGVDPVDLVADLAATLFQLVDLVGDRIRGAPRTGVAAPRPGRPLPGARRQPATARARSRSRRRRRVRPRAGRAGPSARKAGPR